MINERLKKLRKAYNLSQEQVARWLDIPLVTYTRYERNKSAPKYEILEKLCNEYPQYTLWLMTGKTDVPNGQIEPEYTEIPKKTKTTT